MEHIEEACSQMDYIINNLDEIFVSKIPYRIKDFFKNNKSKTYKVNLDVSKPLYEQDLFEETKIYMQIIFKLFIAPKAEKERYISESRKLFVSKNAEKWIEQNKKNN